MERGSARKLATKYGIFGKSGKADIGTGKEK